MVTLDVTLHDTNTGLTGPFSYEYDDDYPHEVIEFMWTEGNFACDCNRSQFLYAGHRIYDCDNQTIEVTHAVLRETGVVLCQDGRWRLDEEV